MNEIDINDTSNINWGAYDDFLKDAEKDTAVGHQRWVVSQVTDDTWPSGDPRRKILGVLPNANNAKADLTVSAPPTPETIAAESASWESGKKRAIAQTINQFKQCIQHYGKSPMKIVEGDEYWVNVIRTKRNPDGTGGFLRVVAFLPSEAANGTKPSGSPF